MVNLFFIVLALTVNVFDFGTYLNTADALPKRKDCTAIDISFLLMIIFASPLPKRFTVTIVLCPFSAI